MSLHYCLALKTSRQHLMMRMTLLQSHWRARPSGPPQLPPHLCSRAVPSGRTWASKRPDGRHRPPCRSGCLPAAVAEIVTTGEMILAAASRTRPNNRHQTAEDRRPVGTTCRRRWARDGPARGGSACPTCWRPRTDTYATSSSGWFV